MFRNTSRSLISRLALANRTGAARSLYTLPEINNVNKDLGIPGLYSPKGFDIVWNQYQSNSAAEFNSRLIELSNENSTASEEAAQSGEQQDFEKSLDLRELTNMDMIMWSKIREVDPAITFHASQLYNNEFFVKGLFQRSRKVDTSSDAAANVTRATREELYRDIEVYHDTDLVDEINVDSEVKTDALSSSNKSSSGIGNVSPFVQDVVASFGSVVSFKELLLAKAEAIFGDGYSWVVYDPRSKKLFVYNTYSSGTPPIFGNRVLKDAQRHVQHDPSGEGHSQNRNLSGSSAGTSSDFKYDLSIDDSYLVSYLIPVLNINVWQHAYLPDYGVFGKRRYLENVWNSINWSVVTERHKQAREYANNYSSTSHMLQRF